MKLKDATKKAQDTKGHWYEMKTRVKKCFTVSAIGISFMLYCTNNPK